MTAYRTASSFGPLRRRHLAVTSALLIVWSVSGEAQAGPSTVLPSAPSVGAGGATVKVDGGTVTSAYDGLSGTDMTVDLSSNGTVVNWNAFNVDTGKSVTFNGTSGWSVLNRVTGTDQSQILGSLAASGLNMWLLNPNGILIGNGASVNTGAFFASTLDMTDLSFTGGTYHLTHNAASDTSSVQVLSGATITTGGPLLLAGQHIDVGGALDAGTSGDVALVAASDMTISAPGSPLGITVSAGTQVGDAQVHVSGSAQGKSVIVAGRVGNSVTVTNALLSIDSGAQLTATADGGRVILTSGIDQAGSGSVAGITGLTGGPLAAVSSAGALTTKALTGGDVIVSSHGTLTQTGAVASGGGYTVNGEDVVTLSGTQVAHGAVTVSGPSISDGGNALTLTANKDDVAAGGDLGITAATGAISLGNATLTAGGASHRTGVTLTTTDNTKAVTTGNITADSLSGLGIQLGNVTLGDVDVNTALNVTTGNGTLTIGGLTVGGTGQNAFLLGWSTTTINGTVSVSGDYTVTTIAGPLKLGGTQAAHGKVTLQANNAISNVAATTVSLTSNKDDAFATGAAGGALKLTAAGDINLGSGSSLKAGGATERNTVTLQTTTAGKSVTVGDVTGNSLAGLGAQSGNISLGDVAVNTTLNVKTTAGTITTGGLTVGGASQNATIDASGAATVNGAVSVSGDYAVTGASVALGGTQGAHGTVTVLSTGGDITNVSATTPSLTSNKDDAFATGASGGAMVLTATGGKIDLGSGSSLKAGGTTRRNDITVTTDAGKTVVLGSVTADTLSGLGAQSAAVTLGDVAVNNALDVETSSGDLATGAVTVSSGDLTLKATSATGNATVGGDVSATGNYTLAAGAAASDTHNVTVGGDYAVTATNGAATLGGTQAAGGKVAVSGNTVTGNAGLALTSHSDSVFAPSDAEDLSLAATGGAVTFNGAATLTGGTAGSKADVTVGGTATTSAAGNLDIDGKAVKLSSINDTGGNIAIAATGGIGGLTSTDTPDLTVDGADKTISAISTGSIKLGDVTAGSGSGAGGATQIDLEGTAVTAGTVRAKDGNLNVVASSGDVTAATARAKGNVGVQASANVRADTVTADSGNITVTATGGDISGQATTPTPATIADYGRTTYSAAAGNSTILVTANSGTVKANTLTAGTGSAPTPVTDEVKVSAKTIDATAVNAKDGDAKLTTQVASGGDITVGSVDAYRNISVDAHHNATAGDLTTQTSGITLNADNAAAVTGNVTTAALSGTGNYTVSGASVTLGTAAATRTQSIAGDVALTATAGNLTSQGDLSLTGNDIRLKATGGNIDFGSSTLGTYGTSRILVNLGTPGSSLKLGTLNALGLYGMDAGGVLQSTLTTDGDITLGNTQLNNSLSVVSTGGNITTGSVTVTDFNQSLSLDNHTAAGKDITAGGALSGDGDLTLKAGRSLHLPSGTSVLGNVLATAGTGDITGAALVPTPASLADYGAANLTAQKTNKTVTATASGGALQLGTVTAGDGAGTGTTAVQVDLEGVSVSVSDAEARDNLLKVIATGGDITATTANGKGGVALTASNNVRLGSAASSLGDIGVTATTGDVTGLAGGAAANLDTTHDLTALNATTGNVQVTSGGLSQVDTITAGGNAGVSATGAAQVVGNVTAGGNYTVSGTSVTLGKASASKTQSAKGAVTLTATGGNLTSRGSLTLTGNSDNSGAEQVSLKATGGNIDLSSATLNGGAARSSDIGVYLGTSGSSLKLGALNARGLYSLNAGNVLQSSLTTDGAITLGTTSVVNGLSVASTGGDLITTATVDVTGAGQALSFDNHTASGHDITLGGAATANGTVTLNAARNLRLVSATSTTADISATAGGAITGLSGAFSGNSDNGYGRANLTASNAAGDITVSSGGLAQLGTVQAGEDITVAAGSSLTPSNGSADITTATAGRDIGVTAWSNSAADAATDGGIRLGTATAARNVTLDNSGGTAGDITATSVTGSTGAVSSDVIIHSANNVRIDTVSAFAPTAGDVTLTADRGDISASTQTGGVYNRMNVDANGDGSRITATAAHDTRFGTLMAGTGSGTPVLDEVLVTAQNIDATTVTAQDGGATLTTQVAGGNDIVVSSATASTDLSIRAANNARVGTGTATGNVSITVAAGDLTGLAFMTTPVTYDYAVLTATQGDISVSSGTDSRLKTLTAGRNIAVTATGVAEVTGDVTAGGYVAGGGYDVRGNAVLLGNAGGAAATQSATGLVRVAATGGDITGRNGLVLTSDSNPGNVLGAPILLEAVSGNVTFGAATTLQAGADRSGRIGVLIGAGGKTLSLGTVNARGLYGLSGAPGSEAYLATLSTNGDITLGATTVRNALSLATDGGDITTNGKVTVTGAGQGLTLTATGSGHDIVANADLSSQGNLNLAADEDVSVTNAYSNAGNATLTAGRSASGTTLKAKGKVKQVVTGTSTFTTLTSGVTGPDLADAGDAVFGGTSGGGILPLPAGSTDATPAADAAPVSQDVEVSAGSVDMTTVTSAGALALTSTTGDIKLGTGQSVNDLTLHGKTDVRVNTATSSAGAIAVTADTGDFSGKAISPAGDHRLLDSYGRAVLTAQGHGKSVTATATAGNIQTGAVTAGDGAGAASAGDQVTLTAGQAIDATDATGITAKDGGVNILAQNGDVVANKVTAKTTATLKAQKTSAAGASLRVDTVQTTAGDVTLTADAGDITGTAATPGGSDFQRMTVTAGGVNSKITASTATGKAYFNTLTAGTGAGALGGDQIAVTAHDADITTATARDGGVNLEATGTDLTVGTVEGKTYARVKAKRTLTAGLVKGDTGLIDVTATTGDAVVTSGQAATDATVHAGGNVRAGTITATTGNVALTSDAGDISGLSGASAGDGRLLDTYDRTVLTANGGTGDVTVTATTGKVQLGAVTAGDQATIYAKDGADITSVTAGNGGVTATADTHDLVLGTTQAPGDVTLKAAGSLHAGTTTSDAGNVALTATAGNITGAALNATPASLSDYGRGTVTASGGGKTIAIAAGNTVKLGAVTAGTGSAPIGGDEITASGQALDISSVRAKDGGMTLTSTVGDVVLGSAEAFAGVTVTANGGLLASLIQSDTQAIAATAGGDIVLTTAQAQTGAALHAVGNIRFGGVTSNTGAVSLIADAGDISGLAGAPAGDGRLLDSFGRGMITAPGAGGNVTITAANGRVQLGTVTAWGAVNLTSGNAISGKGGADITKVDADSAGVQIYGGGIVLPTLLTKGNASVQSSGDISIAQATATSGDLALSAGTGNIALGTGTAGGKADLTSTSGNVAVTTSLASAGDATINAGNDANLASVTSNGGGVSVTSKMAEVAIVSANKALKLATTGNQTLGTGTAGTTADLSSTSGNVAVTTSLASAGDATITAGNDANLASIASSGGSVSVTANTAEVTTASASQALKLATTGAQTLGTGTAGTTADLTATDATTGDVGVTSLTSGGDTTVSAGNDASLASITSTGGSISVTANTAEVTTASANKALKVATTGAQTLGTGTAGTTADLSSTSGNVAVTTSLASAGDATITAGNDANLTSIASSGGSVSVTSKTAEVTTASANQSLKLATTGNQTLGTGTAGTTADLTATDAATGDIGVTSLTSGGAATLKAGHTATLGSVTSSGDAISVTATTANITSADAHTALNVTAGSAMLGTGYARTGAASVATIGDAHITSLTSSGTASVTAGTTTIGSIESQAADVQVTAGSILATTAKAKNRLQFSATSADLALQSGTAGTTADLTSTSGNVAVTTSLTSGGDATINAGNDANLTSVSSTGGGISVTAKTAEVTTASASQALKLATTGSQTLGTGTAGTTADLSSTSGNIAVTSSLTSGGDATINAGNDANLASVTSTGGSISVTSKTAEVTTASASKALKLATTGNQTLGTGTAGTMADLTSTSGNVAVTISLTSGGDATINAGNDANLANVTSTGGSISVTSKTAEVTTASASKALKLATTGNQTLGTGTAGTTADLTSTSGNVAVTTSLTSGGDATINAGNDAMLQRVSSTGGNINVASRTLTGGTLDAGKALGVTTLGNLNLDVAKAGTTAQLKTTGTGDVTLTTLLQSGAKVTIDSAGNVVLALTTAGGGADITAAKTVKLAGLDATGQAVTLKAHDADLSGDVKASSIDVTSDQAMALGDLTGGFNLSSGELNHLKVSGGANAVTFNSGTFGMAIGNAAWTLPDAATRVNLYTTGRVDITGRFALDPAGVGGASASTAARTLVIGGTSAGGSMASIIRVAATASGGGRIDVGQGTLNLRGTAVGVGEDEAFLTAVGVEGTGALATADQVAAQYVSQPTSSLYRARTIYSDPILIRAGTLKVEYDRFALFQNTGLVGQSAGVSLGQGAGSTPTAPVLQIVVGPNSTINSFGLFGDINAISGPATALLGATSISLGGPIIAGNTRINGCVVGAATACLSSSLIQPPLNVFDSSKVAVLSTVAPDLTFDTGISSSNESLFSDISAPATQDEPCDPTANANCPTKENQ